MNRAILLSLDGRLIHYDLAGGYSVKAMSAETIAIDLAESLPPPILADRSYGVPADADNG
jgi:hypothetical protein